MSFRSEITKRLLKTLGPDAWNEFWVALAAKVVEAEKKFKDKPGAGQLKAAEVQLWAHARIAPLLPDWSEPTVFAWLDGILATICSKSNEVLGQDWVSGVESIEAYFASIVEPLLDVDLDGDGKIGSGTAKVGAVMLALLLLSQPGPCHAQRRPLVEHYRPAGVEAPVDAPRPRSDDVRSTRPSPLSAVSVSTWTGYRTNGSGGHSTWDAGLGLTLKASSTWQPSLLFGKGGAGGGIAYKRLGVMAFWDGSLTGGVYLRPFDF